MSDIFLRAFILRRLQLIDQGFGDVLLLGSNHCQGSLHIREFLTRNGHPYRFVDLDSDADSQAMLVKRQPGRIDIGPANLFEFDLYYDIPTDAEPTALRAFGGPSLADFSDRTGVDIAIDAGGS